MPRKKHRGEWVPVAALKKPAPVTPLTIPEGFLVDCLPYRARLAAPGCARRWAVVNLSAELQRGKDQSRFAVKDRFTLCLGCDAGAGRYIETQPEIDPDSLRSSFLPQIRHPRGKK